MFRRFILTTVLSVLTACITQAVDAKTLSEQPAHITLVDVLLKYNNTPTYPPINQAIDAKDYDAVQLLIDNNANLNTRGPQTRIEYLLRIDPFKTATTKKMATNEGKTVLETAVEHRKKSIISFLLKKGADPYSLRTIECFLHNKPDNSPSFVGPVEEHTRNRVDLANYQITSIYYLIKTSDLEILSIFASAGVDFNQICMYDKGDIFFRANTPYTPLQVASLLQNKEVIQFLLDHGAKI